MNQNKYCPRCIEDYEDDDGVAQKGTEEPSDCIDCGVCKDCEHMRDCSRSDDEDYKCGECHRVPPESAPLQPLVTSQGQTADICAVCALMISNLMHGIQRDKFTGSMAEAFRVDTVRHYKHTKQDYDYGN